MDLNKINKLKGLNLLPANKKEILDLTQFRILIIKAESRKEYYC
jgi:hypothetical protein